MTRIRPPGVLLAATLLLAGAIGADAKDRTRPFPQGLYGNVEMSGETGDLGGFEVRFFTDPATGKPMAEFTLCEGWCNTAYIAEVTRTEDGFTFSHVETLEAYNDSGTLTEEDHVVQYHVTPSGKGWKVRLLYDGDDVTAGGAWRIQPIEAPFGLVVARGEESGHAER
ncbi:MAG: hypothetical protein H2049_08885 [Porphyrobacter sp.]|nr:hypothetical protein [Porphyrobacter sp.]